MTKKWIINQKSHHFLVVSLGPVQAMRLCVVSSWICSCSGALTLEGPRLNPQLRRKAWRTRLPSTSSLETSTSITAPQVSSLLENTACISFVFIYNPSLIYIYTSFRQGKPGRDSINRKCYGSPGPQVVKKSSIAMLLFQLINSLFQDIRLLFLT